MDLPLTVRELNIGKNLPLKLCTTHSCLTLASIRSSHVLQNVDDEPYLQQWSYKIIMELEKSYCLMTL